MIDTYQSLRTYFEDLATSHVDVQGFVSGQRRHLQDYFGKSTAQKNIMYLERPSVRLTNNQGSPYIDFYVGIALLSVTDQDHDQEDQSLDLNLEICIEILAKLLEDKRKNSLKFTIEETSNIEPAEAIGIDNCYGWRFEIRLGSAKSLCVNIAKWL